MMSDDNGGGTRCLGLVSPLVHRINFDTRVMMMTMAEKRKLNHRTSH